MARGDRSDDGLTPVTPTTLDRGDDPTFASSRAEDDGPPRIERLLVPLNGSKKSERGLAAAAAIARSQSLPLKVVTFVDDYALVDRTRAYLAKATEPFRALDLSTAVVVDAHPPAAIASMAKPDTLPVMATSGHVYVHDVYLGSAAETVVRRTGHPTMLVGARVEQSTVMDIERVLVPIDGSDLAETAVPVGIDWARRLDVPLWLISVVPERAATALSRHQAPQDLGAESNPLRRVVRRIGDVDVDVQWDVLHGRDAADTIVEAAGATGLVVMTTHGRTGLARLALGSVATKVVRHAHQPVIVHRPPED